MASVISHAVAAVGIGAAFYKPDVPKRVWLLGAACSVFPDIDVVGFPFGVRYGDFWGHRGFTHSLVFAVMLASLAALALFRKPGLQISPAALWAYFLLAAASHGVLDAMTEGWAGRCVFFSIGRDALFSSVASHCGFADRDSTLFWPARFGRVAERSPFDLAAGNMVRGVFGCLAPAGRTIKVESVMVSSEFASAGDFRRRPCTGIAQAKWLIRLVLRVVKTLICCIRFLRWTVRIRST